MISLEQVQLLETRVAKAIDYARKVTAENAALVSERTSLQAKLEANQKRIDELEVLVMRFKEDQSRIEDGIIAALDRLSQFEEAFENSLKDKGAEKKPAAKVREKPAEQGASNPEVFFEIPENQTEKNPKPANADSSSEGELDIF
jgi:predicted nuclease with TOPRIM domain